MGQHRTGEGVKVFMSPGCQPAFGHRPDVQWIALARGNCEHLERFLVAIQVAQDSGLQVQCPSIQCVRLERFFDEIERGRQVAPLGGELRQREVRGSTPGLAPGRLEEGVARLRVAILLPQGQTEVIVGLAIPRRGIAGREPLESLAQVCLGLGDNGLA